MRTNRRHRSDSDALAFVVDALAAYRVTRLLVTDGIADRPRSAMLERLRAREYTKLVELAECPWCTGFWVAAGVVAARRIVPSAWQPIAKVFALSAATGLLASRIRSMDDTHDALEHLDNGDDLSLVRQVADRS